MAFTIVDFVSLSCDGCTVSLSNNAQNGLMGFVWHGCVFRPYFSSLALFVASLPTQHHTPQPHSRRASNVLHHTALAQSWAINPQQNGTKQAKPHYICDQCVHILLVSIHGKEAAWLGQSSHALTHLVPEESPTAPHHFGECRTWETHVPTLHSFVILQTRVRWKPQDLWPAFGIGWATSLVCHPMRNQSPATT